MSASDNDELDVSFEKLLLESDAENGEESDSSEHEEEGGSDLSDSEEEEDSDIDGNSGPDWSEIVIPNDRWPFNDYFGVSSGLNLSCRKPIDFFEEFFNSEILSLVVCETNRYAFQNDTSWAVVDDEEMQKFIGLCLQMG